MGDSEQRKETRDGKETRSGLACGILNTMYTAAINSLGLSS